MRERGRVCNGLTVWRYLEWENARSGRAVEFEALSCIAHRMDMFGSLCERKAWCTCMSPMARARAPQNKSRRGICEFGRISSVSHLHVTPLLSQPFDRCFGSLIPKPRGHVPFF